MDQLGNLLPLAVCAFESVKGASIVCYDCDGLIGMICGLTRWTATYLEGSAKLCDAGMCYTYVKTEAGKASSVHRGCGQLDCDKLPLGYNRTVECEFAVDGWKVRKVQGGIFNQSRIYTTQFPEQKIASGSLQYCDQDRCNSDKIPMANLPSAVQESKVKPLSCFVCKSYADQACGLNFTGSGPVNEVQCKVGHCFTYVTVEAGQMPMITRGCGGISCNLFPGASGSTVTCDENNILAPPDTANGQLFNKSRLFVQPFAPGQPPTESTVQYCNNRPMCNSEFISAFKIKDYYYLTDVKETEANITLESKPIQTSALGNPARGSSGSATGTSNGHSDGSLQRKKCGNGTAGSVRTYNDLEMVFATIARDLSQLDGMETKQLAKFTERIKGYVLDKAYEMYQKACTETGEVYISRMDYLSID